VRSFREIKEGYNFAPVEERRLVQLKPIMSDKAEEVARALSSYIMNTKIGTRLLAEEKRRVHLFDAQKKWFLDMFEGKYDNIYYDRLIRIGIIHFKNGIDAHYLSRAVNIIRNLGVNILYEMDADTEETLANILAFEKILDINLDVMTSSYIEEETRSYSSMYKIKSTLVDFSEKFVQSANLILILSLIGLSSPCNIRRIDS
jgi:hypothetical protein